MIPPIAPKPTPYAAQAQAQARFSDTLGTRLLAERTGQDKATTLAKQLVATSLVQPILKNIRTQTWAAPPFGPAKGEESFRALLDTELAQRLVDSARWPLIERLARDVRSRTQPQATDGP